MAANVSLTVNRSLLDPNFESYRLSLDPIPIYSVQLHEGVDEVALSEEQYTRDHVRVYGMRNHLVGDPWDATSVYYVDGAGRVQRARVALDTYLRPPVPVFRLAREVAARPGRVGASVHFLSEERAALCDGAGTLLVLHTGPRAAHAGAAWEVVYNGEASPASLVVDGLQRAGATGAALELLLLRVERDPAASSKSGYRTAMEWLTLEPDEGVAAPARFSVTRRRELTGPAAPFYSALEPSGTGVVVAAERALRVTGDSARPVEPEAEEEVQEEPRKQEEEEKLETDDASAPAYQWQQTPEDVTVLFKLREDTAKGDVEVTVTRERVAVVVAGSVAPLLQGELAGRADPEGSAWTWSPGRLELTLMKADPGEDWAQLLAGGANGATQGDDFERRVGGGARTAPAPASSPRRSSRRGARASNTTSREDAGGGAHAVCPLFRRTVFIPESVAGPRDSPLRRGIRPIELTRAVSSEPGDPSSITTLPNTIDDFLNWSWASPRSTRKHHG